MQNERFAERFYSHWLALRDYEQYCAAKAIKQEEWRQLSIFPRCEEDLEPDTHSLGSAKRGEFEDFEYSDIEEF